MWSINQRNVWERIISKPAEVGIGCVAHVASVMKAHQLLIDNLAAARGSCDDNDSLAGLIVTFFSGICLEQNLGPDRARITKKIDAFMRLIRAI